MAPKAKDVKVKEEPAYPLPPPPPSSRGSRRANDDNDDDDEPGAGIKGRHESHIDVEPEGEGHGGAPPTLVAEEDAPLPTTSTTTTTTSSATSTASDEQGESAGPPPRVLVAEYDAFVCQRHVNELVMMHFPLMDHDHDFDFQSMRIKRNAGKVEVDFELDQQSENYSKRSEWNAMTTNTYSSSSIPHTTNLAIGYIYNNQVHLTPTRTAVKMATSFSRIDARDKEKKEREEAPKSGGSADGAAPMSTGGSNTAASSEVKKIFKRKESERAIQSRHVSYEERARIIAKEEWIVCSRVDDNDDPEVKQQARTKLISMSSNVVTPYESQIDYVSALVHEEEKERRSADTSNILSLSNLESKTPQERMEMLLDQVEVFAFRRLQELVQCGEDELVRMLCARAWCIRGVWIVRTEFLGRYSSTPHLAIARDYLLTLFAMCETVQRREFGAAASVRPQDSLAILKSIAVSVTGVGWQLKVESDLEFSVRYNYVTHNHEQTLRENHPLVMRALVDPSTRYFEVDDQGKYVRIAHVVVAGRVGGSTDDDVQNFRREVLTTLLRDSGAMTLFYLHKNLRAKHTEHLAELPHARVPIMDDVKAVLKKMNVVAFNNVYVLRELGDENDPVREIVLQAFASSTNSHCSRTEIEGKVCQRLGMKAQEAESRVEQVIKHVATHASRGLWKLKEGTPESARKVANTKTVGMHK